MPETELAQFINSQVTIEGTFYPETWCHWVELASSEDFDVDVTVHQARVIFYNTSMVACAIDPIVYKRAGLESLVLHLTRDNITYESFADEGQEMIFHLW